MASYRDILFLLLHVSHYRLHRLAHDCKWAPFQRWISVWYGQGHERFHHILVDKSNVVFLQLRVMYAATSLHFLNQRSCSWSSQARPREFLRGSYVCPLDFAYHQLRVFSSNLQDEKEHCKDKCRRRIFRKCDFDQRTFCYQLTALAGGVSEQSTLCVDEARICASALAACDFAHRRVDKLLDRLQFGRRPGAYLRYLHPTWLPFRLGNACLLPCLRQTWQA